MDEIRFGIIGYGKMGKIRHQTLEKLPSCRVVHICDINPVIDRPEAIRFTTDWRDIVFENNIDAIVVATSNDMLRDLVVAGLENQKHVFCEKPPGRNISELKKMMVAEEQSIPLKLMFGFNHRHHKSVMRAMEIIDSGEYGTVLWTRGRYGKSVDNSFYSNWRSQKKIAGGGIFLDQGIHMLDLFLMICGNFEEVKAYVSNLYWNLDIEDNLFAILRNEKGQVASLHSTMTQWRHLFSLEIFLERGYITINGLKTNSNSYGDEVLSIAKNRTLPPSAKWTDEEKIVYHVDTSWQNEMALFIDSIRNNTKISVGNTKDALKLMTLVEKIYQET